MLGFSSNRTAKNVVYLFGVSIFFYIYGCQNHLFYDRDLHDQIILVTSLELYLKKPNFVHSKESKLNEKHGG